MNLHLIDIAEKLTAIGCAVVPVLLFAVVLIRDHKG